MLKQLHGDDTLYVKDFDGNKIWIVIFRDLENLEIFCFEELACLSSLAYYHIPLNNVFSIVLTNVINKL